MSLSIYLRSWIVWFLIFGVFLGKVVYLYFLDLPLSYDESYYWDWSRNIAWGYFSKPPMVAWVIWLFNKILGISEFAVRFPAVLSISVSGLFFYLLVKKYTENLNKVIIYLVTFFFIPILVVYSFIMTIDPLLICFWMGATYFLNNYIEKPIFKNAFLTGMFIGLGLLTKQTMVVFLFLTFIYFFFFKKERLKNIHSFFIFFIPVMMILPNIYWNYTHEFVMFRHTEEHFSKEGFSLVKGLKFIGESIILYSPLVIVFCFKVFKDLKIILKQKDLLTFLYLNGVLFLFSWVFSFFIELNINWVLPFGISTIVYLILRVNKTSNMFKVSVFFSMVFSLLILVFGYKHEVFPAKAQEILKKFKGWRELANLVEKFHDQETPMIVSSRDIASSLAFYLSYHPKVYVVKKRNFPENQYHIWRDDKELYGKEIFFVQKGTNTPLYLKDPIKICEVKVKISKVLDKEFSLWRGIWDHRDKGFN